MASINVDPEGLRDAGEQMNTARETLIDQSNGNLLHGVGQDQHISTAGFWPGVWAQKQLTNRYNEAQQAFLNINNNFIAISSALYIVADVFNSTDQRNAFEFAFLNPNAQTPSGLPAYMLDPQTGKIRTSVEFRAQAEAEVALNGGGLPPGWTRRERTTSPYSKVMELVDANGNVVAAMYTSTTPGEKRISYYRGDQLMSTRVERTSSNGSREVTVYDGQDRRIRSMHQIHQENGSTTYYTNVYDPEHPDRDPTREDEITVGSETAGAQPGEDIVRQQRDSEFVARNRQMYQTAVDGPAEPSNYDGAVNRISY